MNKRHFNLFIALSLLLWTSPAWSFDRSEFVHSKIQSTLSSFLDASSFLVIVNRTDSLESGGDQSGGQGLLKQLPGLSLAVDGRGEVVQQGAGSSSYFGPVIAKVIIDETVADTTFQMVDTLLAEIVGGVNPADELTVSRGLIKQKPPEADTKPQIQINNNIPEKSDASNDNLRTLALILIVMSALMWFLMKQSQSKSSASGADNSRDGQGASKAAESAAAAASITAGQAAKESETLSELDTTAPALFLMKALKENHLNKVRTFLDFADGRLQRKTFQAMPAWVLTHLNKKMETFVPLDEETGEKYTLRDRGPELRGMVSEIALIEQSLKSSTQRYKALLQWFSPVGLRYVSQRHRDHVSPRTKAVLWNLRSDLGLFAAADDSLKAEDMTSEDFESAWNELHLLPSSEFDKESDGFSDVERWVTSLNQLEEFGPIESQLKLAGEKLSPIDFKTLMGKVCHLETPLTFSRDDRKEWLRNVNPEDYFWWQEMLGEAPPWKLEEELRPLRLAAFREAERAQTHKTWPEDDKKQSAKRILFGLRKVQFKDNTDAAVA